MRRRDLLRTAAMGAGAVALRSTGVPFASGEVAKGQQAVPVAGMIRTIDTHIHLFDTMRPGGVPWPEKTDTEIYKPALPDRYEALSSGLGVVGAIAIEASSLPTDNQWVLNLARNHPLIVGVVGNLVPSDDSFLDELERLHGDPLFLGIRYGNLWNRDLGSDLESPGFIDGLKALAKAGLVLDTANPDAHLIGAVVEVAERVPDLRIVIEHLPHAPVPTDADERDRYWANLKLLASSPRVFVKLSEIPVRVNGKLLSDPQPYRASLDAIWDVFGEDRIMFGSDWPNSDHVATYAQTYAIVRGYMAKKSPATHEKFYWKNSIAAYKWQRRRENQPVVS
jgi:predicted TIM-barrel fold metal-dependent hydrolase